ADGHRDELVAVVDVERHADELRQDRAAPRPGLDRCATALVLRLLCLLQQRQLDERAFPYGTRPYRLPLLLRVARTDDHLVRLLVVASTGALSRLAPRSDRVAAARGTAFTATMRVIDRVLRNAASKRLNAHPPLATRLGEVLVLV